MQIRTRLILSFTAIASLILIAASVSIYVFSSEYRKDDFYQRMVNKGTNAAKLLLEVEEIDASILRRIEKDNPSNLPNEQILIFDYKNQPLYSSDEAKNLPHDEVFLNKVRLNQQVRYHIKDKEAVGFLFTDKYDRFVVLVAARDIYGLKKLDNLLNVLLIVSGIGVLLAFLGGWFFATQTVRPIQQVIKEVQEIGIDNLHVRVNDGNGKDEIALLAQTFNQMLARLQRAFTLQKNFIANASHELRTPLTIISGQIEVLLRKKRTNEEYQELLTSVFDEISSLSKASNQLLLLAQTSSEGKDESFQPVRFDEVIWQVKNEIQKVDDKTLIEVHIGESEDEAFNFEVEGNPHLLKTVVTNLMENGCKYSEDKKVRIDIHSDEHTLFVEFSNTMTQEALVDKALLFEPFYRGKNTLGRRGNGLGLSLVKNIMERHKGRIYVTSNENTFLIRVELPVK